MLDLPTITACKPLSVYGLAPTVTRPRRQRSGASRIEGVRNVLDLATGTIVATLDDDYRITDFIEEAALNLRIPDELPLSAPIESTDTESVDGFIMVNRSDRDLFGAAVEEYLAGRGFAAGT